MQPDANPVLEAFKAQMIEKHELTLRASMELVRIADGVLFKPLAEPLHKVIRSIARVMVNSNGAVLTVATAGYGNDAAKIVRSMFDGAVTIAHLRLHPELVADYIDFFRIWRWQYYESRLAEDPDSVKELPAETVEEMKMEYEAVLPRFQNRRGDILGSWCRVSVRQRADAVGVGMSYPAFHAQASGMQHLDMSGLVSQASANGFDVEVAPSGRYVRESLAMSFNLTFRALFDFDQAAAPGFNYELEVVHNFYIAAKK